MPRDTSNSGRTGMGGGFGGGGGGGCFGGGGWGGGGRGNGGGGWGGGNLRGRDGMTASQRAQTRDSRLGLKTGNTWHGNTAFGRPGQMASGFATMSNAPAGYGMGPTRPSYGNFKDVNGNPVGPVRQNKPAFNKQPVPAGAPVPGQPLQNHPFAGLTTAMLPGFFGGGIAPSEYTSMGPWPGQSAIPNNPPVYTPRQANTRPAQKWSVEGGNGVTALTGLSLPGYGKQFYDRVPQGNNSQSGSGRRNNGWTGGGWGGGGGGGW